MPKMSSHDCCPDPQKSLPVLETSKAKEGRLVVLSKAISHPIRLKILSILKEHKECICGSLVDQLPLSQATVSQHLKVLKNAGLIRGRISGAATCYCIEPAALKQFKELVKEL